MKKKNLFHLLLQKYVNYFYQHILPDPDFFGQTDPDLVKIESGSLVKKQTPMWPVYLFRF